MPAGRAPGSLPADPTSFVGREEELARLTELIGRARLITVTGVGGVGKTRLVRQAARLVGDWYADGVCLVELSALQVSSLLPSTVGGAIGIHGLAARASMEAVTGYLRGREMLLILDTCEHLTQACGVLARTIVREAPGVTVLATSRQPLGVTGERTFVLTPLPVSGERAPGDAVDLFAQRAADAVPGFTLDDGNHADAVALCRRLAGIPLALELAAVQLGALSLRELAEGFGLDTGSGAEGAVPKRHQSLRTALTWSYELCTSEERALWRRLSVFAGSFSMGAAVAVCADRDLEARDVPDVIDGLVAKSVLTEEDGDRYRLLDPVREFGLAELSGSGAEAARGRHVRYYLGVAREFDRKAVSSEQLVRFTALRRDHANIQAAIEYGFTTPGNDRAAVDIATSLVLYWHMAGLAWEGEYWVNRSLERGLRPGAQRARILAVRGYLLCSLGEIEAGRRDAIEAIKMAERFGDTATVARGYGCLHRALTWCDDLGPVSEIEDTTIRLMEDEGDTLGLAMVAVQKGMAELQAKAPATAADACRQWLSRLPDGELWATSYLLGVYGIARFLAGKRADGAAALRRALTMKYELADAVGVAYGLGVLGLMAADQRRYERAAWLFGAAESLWGRAGRRYTGNVFLEEWQRRSVANARESLGDATFTRLWDRGATASPEAFVLFAVTDAGDPASSAAQD